MFSGMQMYIYVWMCTLLVHEWLIFKSWSVIGKFQVNMNILAPKNSSPVYGPPKTKLAVLLKIADMI
jgi:hypothetical protein